MPRDDPVTQATWPANVCSVMRGSASTLGTTDPKAGIARPRARSARTARSKRQPGRSAGKSACGRGLVPSGFGAARADAELAAALRLPLRGRHVALVFEGTAELVVRAAVAWIFGDVCRPHCRDTIPIT